MKPYSAKSTPSPSPNPGPVVDQSAVIADLRSQVVNIQNEVNGTATILLEVARVLKTPGNVHLGPGVAGAAPRKTLTIHAQEVMALLTPEAIAKLDAAVAEAAKHPDE